MKLVLKLIVGFCILVVGGLAAVFYLTGDMVTTADNFFNNVQQNKLEVAYQDLSEAFKSSTTIEQLGTFLSSSGLKDYREVSWNSRSVNGSVGELKGSVTTTNGGTIPLEVQLVKENGDWRIQHLSRSATGIENSQPTPKADSLTKKLPKTEVPSNDDLVALVKETTSAFGKSVDAKNMEGFHSYISSLWRSQFDVNKLEDSYGKLYKMGAKWESLESKSPIFESEPIIDERGVLIIQGYYPTKPDQLTFTYKYLVEGLDWKLLGLHVKLRKPEVAPSQAK